MLLRSYNVLFRERAGVFHLRDLRVIVTKHLTGDLVGMLTEQRRAFAFDGRIGQLDRATQVVPLVSLG